MQRSATPFETDWADTGMVAMTCERSREERSTPHNWVGCTSVLISGRVLLAVLVRRRLLPGR